MNNHAPATPALNAKPHPDPAGPGQVLSETLALFILFLVLAQAIDQSWLGALQFALVGWNFLAYVLMAALAGLAIAVSRRPPTDFGLNFESLQDPAVRRTINLAVIELAAIWAALILVPGIAAGGAPAFIMPPAFFAASPLWPKALATFIGGGITAVFTTVFFGGLSELFYRGVIQSSLTRVLPRPYKLFNTEFGWGLFITAVLYAIGQGLLIYNAQISEPPAADLRFGPVMAGLALLEGLILGFLYEKTRTLIAPVVLHAAIGFLFFAIEVVP